VRIVFFAKLQSVPNIFAVFGAKVPDPHPFHADPDPGFEINADPDPDLGLDFFS